MGVPWKPKQQKAIYDVLQRYPAESGRCDAAASAILPIARECDTSARILRIVPSANLKKAIFIVPVKWTEKWGLPWRVHYTTEVLAYCVDALTGEDGTVTSDYLKTHWKYSEALEIQPV